MRGCKAPNWQTVMRDPARARSGDPRLSRGRERLCGAALADTEALQDDAVRRDEGAHQGGRLLGADARTGPTPISAATARAGSIRCSAAQPRDGGAEQVLLDGDALAAGKAFFQLGGDAPFARPSADRVVGRRGRARNSTPLRVRDLATGADLADVVPDVAGARGVDRGFVRLLLRAARRASPPVARLSPPARHAGGRRRAGLRGARRRLSSSRSAELQSGRFAEISVHDHETSESWLIDLAIADARPTLVAPRETVGALRRRASSRLRRRRRRWSSAPTPTAPRTSRSRSRRSRRPAAAHWRDLVPHRPGVYRAGVHGVCRLADPARARGRPAAHRRACSSRAARSTRSRLPRKPIRSASDGGYEFATDTLRFTYSSMTTPNEVVGLRPRKRDARACASARKSRAATIRPTT